MLTPRVVWLDVLVCLLAWFVWFGRFVCLFCLFVWLVGWLVGWFHSRSWFVRLLCLVILSVVLTFHCPLLSSRLKANWPTSLQRDTRWAIFLVDEQFDEVLLFSFTASRWSPRVEDGSSQTDFLLGNGAQKVARRGLDAAVQHGFATLDT